MIFYNWFIYVCFKFIDRKRLPSPHTTPDEDIQNIITTCHNNISQLITNNEEIDNIIHQLQTKQIENKNEITQMEYTIIEHRHRLKQRKYAIEKENASKFLWDLFVNVYIFIMFYYYYFVDSNLIESFQLFDSGEMP